jgi:hypothetical protein
MENTKEHRCKVCQELNKKIELAVFSWEAVEFEVLAYRHKVQGSCSDEKAVA